MQWATDAARLPARCRGPVPLGARTSAARPLDLRPGRRALVHGADCPGGADRDGGPQAPAAGDHDPARRRPGRGRRGPAGFDRDVGAREQARAWTSWRASAWCRPSRDVADASRRAGPRRSPAARTRRRSRRSPRSMPPAAHAVPSPGQRSGAVWAPDALLRAYLDAIVDALVRAALRRRRASGSAVEGEGDAPRTAWADRWRTALGGAQRSFDDATASPSARSWTSSTRWSEPALGARDRAARVLSARAAGGRSAIRSSLRFLLQSPDDPSLLVPAARGLEDEGAQPREARARVSRSAGVAARGARARLRASLRRSRARSRRRARVASISIRPPRGRFLGEGAALLAEAGFGVIVPGELTAAGQRRLRLRMRVGGEPRRPPGSSPGPAGLGARRALRGRLGGRIGDETPRRRASSPRSPSRRRRSCDTAARGSRSIRASSPTSRGASPRGAPKLTAARGAPGGARGRGAHEGRLSVARRRIGRRSPT